MQSYRELKVWQMGIGLAKNCYAITSAFPKEEMFGITNQIRRAATSIPANIAEGYGRETTGDYIRFLRIAQGSLKELETFLIISYEVGIAERDPMTDPLATADRMGRMIRSLIRKLQERNETQ